MRIAKAQKKGKKIKKNKTHLDGIFKKNSKKNHLQKKKIFKKNEKINIVNKKETIGHENEYVSKVKHGIEEKKTVPRTESKKVVRKNMNSERRKKMKLNKQKPRNVMIPGEAKGLKRNKKIKLKKALKKNETKKKNEELKGNVKES